MTEPEGASRAFEDGADTPSTVPGKSGKRSAAGLSDVSSDVSWVEPSGDRAVVGVPNARIGAYVVERELGRGGQGAVFLARDERLGRRVALKALASPWAASEAALRRFEAEARTLAALDHPGLCAVYEAAESDGVRFIAMRYVEGSTLADDIVSRRAARGGGPPRGAELARVLLVVERAARAVHAAHEAGVVHRDLKPGNVMIDADGAPVVLDFGLARAEGSDDFSRTATGDILGTPAYMAPEQAAGDTRAIDRRADVHALGVLLYELATDRRPFEGGTRAALLEAVRFQPTPEARKTNSAVTGDLDVVIATATAKAPADRYATALAFADDLRRARLYEPIAARPVSFFGRVVRWARRRPASAALVATLAVLVSTTCVFIGLYFGDRDRVERQKEREIDDAVDNELQEGFMRMLGGDGEGLKRSLAAFDAAERLRPRRREIAYGRALAHLAGRSSLASPAKALEIIDAYAEREGYDGVLRRLRSDALLRLGREEEAARETAAAAAPSDDFAFFIEALRHERRAERNVPGANEAAVDAIETAILLSPVRREVYTYWLSYLVGRTHRLETARRVAVVARILNAGPTGERSAGIALSTADPTAALEAFERARPDLLRGGDAVLQGIAQTLYQSGRYEEAIRAFKKLVELRPDDATQYFNLSIVEQNHGDKESALVAARRAAELRPDVLDFTINYAGRLVRTGRDPARALEVLDAALALDSTSFVAKIERSLCLATLNRVDEALACLRSCESEVAGSGFEKQWRSVFDWAQAAQASSRPASQPASKPASSSDR